MRLLNIHNHTFREFHGANIPPYLIASHRWTADETTFKDVLKNRNKSSLGWRKIEGFCERARRDNELLVSFENATCCEWVWIDTACIDKRSSAEVSESINSMFAWYSGAQECHAYLADVKPFPASQQLSEVLDDFKNSEWFKRGWTLQELLAPRCVVFFTQTWQIIGHKCADCKDEQSCEGAGPLLNTTIAEITGIPEEVLRDYERSKAISVEEKMRWQVGRRTTRIEDRAYCLLGLFDVHMPLLYGEGEKAMLRLERTVVEELERPWHSQLLLNFNDFAPSTHSSRSVLPRSGRPLAIMRYSDVEGEVSCICGYGDDDGFLVACDICQFWQHALCYFPATANGQGFASDQEHRCIRCCPRTVDAAAAKRRQKAKRAPKILNATAKEFVSSQKRTVEEDVDGTTQHRQKRHATSARLQREVSSLDNVKFKMHALRSEADAESASISVAQDEQTVEQEGPFHPTGAKTPGDDHSRASQPEAIEIETSVSHPVIKPDKFPAQESPQESPWSSTPPLSQLGIETQPLQSLPFPKALRPHGTFDSQREEAVQIRHHTPTRLSDVPDEESDRNSSTPPSTFPTVYLSPNLSPQDVQSQVPQTSYLYTANPPFYDPLAAGPNRQSQYPRVPFPTVESIGSVHQGFADHMSPPEINIDFAPPASHIPFRADDAADALSPPMRTQSRNRIRAKSDSVATSPSRGRSPAMQTPATTQEATLPASQVPEYGDSPGGRRSSSNASDQRDYILNLAAPERWPSDSGDKTGRIEKHPGTFSCQFCSKRFTRAYNLRAHLRTHTEERPFVCAVCGKAFARQYERKRHETLHDGEKRFSCVACGRRFARENAFNRHRKEFSGKDGHASYPGLAPFPLDKPDDLDTGVMEERESSQDGTQSPANTPGVPDSGEMLINPNSSEHDMLSQTVAGETYEGHKETMFDAGERQMTTPALSPQPMQDDDVDLGDVSSPLFDAPEENCQNYSSSNMNFNSTEVGENSFLSILKKPSSIAGANSPRNSPSAQSDGSGFRTVHGQHRPDDSFGGYRTGKRLRRMRSGGVDEMVASPKLSCPESHHGTVDNALPDIYMGMPIDSYSRRPRRAPLVDYNREQINSFSPQLPPRRPTVVQQDYSRLTSPPKDSKEKDYYITPASSREPRKSEHKKLYTVNDGGANLVADVDVPAKSSSSVDGDDSVALKRARTIVAARKSRTQEIEERETLEARIADLQSQVEHSKSLSREPIDADDDPFAGTSMDVACDATVSAPYESYETGGTIAMATPAKSSGPAPAEVNLPMFNFNQFSPSSAWLPHGHEVADPLSLPFMSRAPVSSSTETAGETAIALRGAKPSAGNASGPTEQAPFASSRPGFDFPSRDHDLGYQGSGSRSGINPFWPGANFTSDFSQLPEMGSTWDPAKGAVDPALVQPYYNPALPKDFFPPYMPIQSWQPDLGSNGSRRQTSSFESFNTPDDAIDESNKGLCPVATCGRPFKDLKAHMLTHQNERPEKCPIPTCEYHTKGFARKYDQNRHVLTHYKGEMTCRFCPSGEGRGVKTFNRADVFKRHLTAVHGVQQRPPNERRGPVASETQADQDTVAGECSLCSQLFTSPQQFYDHLDDCVLQIVRGQPGISAVEEVSYTCPHAECAAAGVEYRYYRDLKLHMRQMHGEGVVEMFACPADGCERLFSRKDRMLEHQRLVHGAEVKRRAMGST